MTETELHQLVDEFGPAVAAHVAQALAPLLARITALEAREPPMNGAQGATGEAGKEGSQGPPGAEGRGIKDAVIDSDGRLVLVFSDGQLKTVGPIKGSDGKDGAPGAPGENGKDGAGFGDLRVEADGERGFLFTTEKDGVTKQVGRVTVPAMIYRGVFRDGSQYVRGDVTTWDGSTWHCNADTSEKPNGGNKAWTLTTKRGSDGKDGAPGKQGAIGPAGKNGMDGRKW